MGINKFQRVMFRAGKITSQILDTYLSMAPLLPHTSNHFVCAHVWDVFIHVRSKGSPLAGHMCKVLLCRSKSPAGIDLGSLHLEDFNSQRENKVSGIAAFDTKRLINYIPTVFLQ